MFVEGQTSPNSIPALMDLCLHNFGFVDGLRKFHGLEMQQGPPKSGGDLECA